MATHAMFTKNHNDINLGMYFMHRYFALILVVERVVKSRVWNRSDSKNSDSGWVEIPKSQIRVYTESRLLCTF